MRKRILSAVLAFFLVVSLLPTSAWAYPAPDYGAQNAVEKFNAGVPMSVAHRAAWRMGPENSLLAIAAGINMGLDVVELDVKLTKDGVAVLSHDENIRRCTAECSGYTISDFNWEDYLQFSLCPEEGGSGVTTAYTLSEAEAALLNSLPHYAEHCGEAAAGGTITLSRLDDAVDLIKMLGEDIMINLDHCFSQSRFVACYTLFRETDMLERVFFKNSTTAEAMNAWYAAAAEAWNAAHPEETITAQEVQQSILYVYINSSESTAALQSHLDNGDNLVMVEICIANDEADAKIHKALEPWCKSNNVAMFVNTMWSGLCSTKPDTQTTWAEMIERGYTAIQTDRPSELVCYFNAIHSQRTAEQAIEAEHFNLFNYNEDYGFSVPAACDDGLNKKVEGMENGDWMRYDDILFDGSETMLELTLQAMTVDAQLELYVDEMSAENRIAAVTLSKSADYQTVLTELSGSVEAGVHTVYVKAIGLPDCALVSLDRFRFVSSSSMVGEPVIAPVSVVVEPGVAPELPGSVSVSYGDVTYGFKVDWEEIPASLYASEGVFTVLGYIARLNTYVEATVTVRAIHPEITEEGLALWLDASSGITADESGVVSAWEPRVGSASVVKSTGDPTLKTLSDGTSGIYFDGKSAMTLNLSDENFWNDKSEFTVVMYSASDMTTSGASSGTQSQYHSALYFWENSSWGSAYFTASQNEVIFRFGSGVSGDYGTTYVRPASIGSSFTCTAFRKDGLANGIFVDGEEIYSGLGKGETTKGIQTADGLIGRGKADTYYKGTICEILIYDRALSDAEIIAAQRALAEKYADEIVSVEEAAVTCEEGQEPKLPKTVEVTYASGTTTRVGVVWETINPSLYLSAGSFSVAGTLFNGMAVTAQVTVVKSDALTFDKMKESMLLWFSAQSGINADASGSVSAWRELSGHSTADASAAQSDKQPTVVTDEEENILGVRFDGNDVLTFAMTDKELFNNKTGLTAVIFSKPEMDAPTKINDNHKNSVLYFGEYSPGWSGMYVGAFTNGAAGRFGTGAKNYRGILYQGGSYSGYTTTVLTKNGKTIDSLSINGTAITAVETATGAATEKTSYIDATSGQLGMGKNSSGWKGTVSEIIVFDHVLSEAELTLVDAYLKATYPVDSGNQTVATDGLLFWLDASKGVTSDASGNVTAWTSQGGVDLTAAVKTSGSGISGRPIYVNSAVNGQGGVRFAGNSALTLTLGESALNGLSGATVIAYAASNTPLGTGSNHDTKWWSQRNTLFTVDEAASWGSVYLGVYTDTISARFGTGTSQDYGVYGTMRTPTTDFTATAVRWNGATMAYDVEVDGTDYASGSSMAAATKNNKNIIYLGAGKDGKMWTGTLCELLFYDRALSDDELNSIYRYLDEKYTVVGPQPVAVSGLYFKEADTQLTLHVGETQALTACTVPANADNTTLLWNSSNPSVVSVDEAGQLTAAALGSSVISVTTEDGGYTLSCIVRVTNTDSQDLWADIQNMLTWAAAQDANSFSNWADMQAAIDAAKELSAESDPDALRAAYQALRAAKLALTVKVLTVTFNTDCDIVVEPVEVLYGQTIAPVEVNRVGYELDGWFLDGTAFDFTTPIYEDITLTAQWTAKFVLPSVNFYRITLAACEGGSVRSDHRNALPGEIVTLTITPDADYTLEAITVIDSDGGKLTLAGSNGVYTFSMPGSDVTVTAVFASEEAGEEPTISFVDVTEKDYFYEAALWAARTGITTGTDDTHFSPNLVCSRAQLVTFLWRAANKPVVNYAMSFADVDENDWYGEAVRWAASTGIVKGYSNGLFGTEDSITREQAVTMLYRFAAAQGIDVSIGEDTNILSYTDALSISDYAFEAMQWACGAGIMQGYNGALMPADVCNRAQIVTMLYRLIG